MSWLIHFWLWASIAIVLLVWLQFLLNLRVLLRLRAGPIPERCPLVSVLVPARNEAKRIGPCLRSLLAQDYPNFECIVLDDQSEDDTANVVRQLGFATEPVSQFRLVSGGRCRSTGSVNRGPAINSPSLLAVTIFCSQMQIRSITPAQSRPR